jgi:hypothetical protein
MRFMQIMDVSSHRSTNRSWQSGDSSDSLAPLCALLVSTVSACISYEHRRIVIIQLSQRVPSGVSMHNLRGSRIYYLTATP